MELDLDDINGLTEFSKKIRRDAVIMAYKACSSHVGAALSMADILAVLYFRFLILRGAIEVNSFPFHILPLRRRR